MGCNGLSGLCATAAGTGFVPLALSQTRSHQGCPPSAVLLVIFMDRIADENGWMQLTYYLWQCENLWSVVYWVTVLYIAPVANHSGSASSPLTKQLCTGKRRKLLLSSEQVPVSVGQLPVELLQLGEPPPRDHLLHVFRMTLGHKLQNHKGETATGLVIVCWTYKSNIWSHTLSTSHGSVHSVSGGACINRSVDVSFILIVCACLCRPQGISVVMRGTHEANRKFAPLHSRAHCAPLAQIKGSLCVCLLLKGLHCVIRE